MQLKEWAKKQNKTIADVSRYLNCRHCVVRRWFLGLAIPRMPMMQKIFELTDGQVTANDFYEVVQ